MKQERLVELSRFYRAGLVDDTVAFWERHGVDREDGGFLTCLERDGSVYCTDKAVWLNGRATWLFATLYREVEQRDSWLELARHGYDFLVSNCFDQNGKMYFSVAKDGSPLRMRRYVFSEVFGVMASAALAKATGDEQIKRKAVELFNSFVRYNQTPGMIVPKFDPNTRPMKGLSPLMCLVNLADTMLMLEDDSRYEKLIDGAVEEIFRDFVRPEEGVVLETVGPDGQRLDDPKGRVMSPGHSIETAWFLMEVAKRRDDDALMHRAVRIVDWAFDIGWDQQYGGLLYFVDVDGKPSEYLEHDMKLWWPHGEALYALLLAYHLTGDESYAAKYDQVHEWTFAHFPDPEFGEWFGYLHRDGSLSSDLKGNMWKGPFHLPRAQMLCWKLLEEMIQR